MGIVSLFFPSCEGGQGNVRGLVLFKRSPAYSFICGKRHKSSPLSEVGECLGVVHSLTPSAYTTCVEFSSVHDLCTIQLLCAHALPFLWQAALACLPRLCETAGSDKLVRYPVLGQK